jgi:membrane protein implicated in regulation of membrane protease activity
VIVGIAIGVGSVVAVIIYYVVRAHRRQATTGREELPGKTAIVKVALEPEGTILHQGELWTAILDEGKAKPGEEVIITRFDGLKLYVTKKLKDVKQKQRR